MSQLYCNKCGGATQFTFDRPIFCSFCSNKFGDGLGAGATVAKIPTVQKLDYEITKEDHFEADTQQSVKNASVSIDIGSEGPTKMRQVLGSGAAGLPKRKVKNKIKDAKAFILQQAQKRNALTDDLDKAIN